MIAEFIALSEKIAKYLIKTKLINNKKSPLRMQRAST